MAIDDVVHTLSWPGLYEGSQPRWLAEGARDCSMMMAWFAPASREARNSKRRARRCLCAAQYGTRYRGKMAAA